jgi:hypothetical protein
VIAIVDNRSVLDEVALVLVEQREPSIEEKRCQSASEKSKEYHPETFYIRPWRLAPSVTSETKYVLIYILISIYRYIPSVLSDPRHTTADED